MIPGVPFSEIAYLTLALIAGGMVSGFLAGLLGIGGGAIAVPILYEIFRIVGVSDNVRMQVCVATSLAIIIPTAFQSVRSHRKRGAVDVSVIRTLGPWVMGGAIAGVFVAAHAPGGFLKAVFIASTLFIAYRLAFGAEKVTGSGALPSEPWPALTGAVIGLVSTLIGIGGGSYVTAYMRHFGWSMHTAVGTASGFGPIIAIPAVLGYIVEGWGLHIGIPLTLGYVSLLGALIVSPVTVLAAPFGVRAAHSLSMRHLEITFIVFLLLTAARFSASLVFHV